MSRRSRGIPKFSGLFYSLSHFVPVVVQVILRTFSGNSGMREIAYGIYRKYHIIIKNIN